ncbi:glycosyltransferase [Klebsiella variicola]|uniref:glycosyltransferase n=1 Tax=Klebsiella variicola TaxID=244366 RepID=UPI00223145EC|nr:glycosyltransferase [Klebsiella variicola]HCI8762728.1 glycosyltransferase [Klebsiella variicola]
MKVLHIISSPAAGGAEMYVKDLSIAMAEKGHDVFILFISHAKEIARDTSFEMLFLEEIRNKGIQYDFIGNSCKKNPLKGIFKLRKVVHLFKPDVIHSHLYYGAVFSLFAKAKRKVYTHHNIDLGANKNIYKLLDLGIDDYIGICRACQDMLKKIARQPVTLITNGVAENRIIKKDNYHPGSPLRILMAGRLTVQKNFKLMLDALAHNPNLNINLQIAGEGPERQLLEDYATRIGLLSKVTFLGNCDNIKEIMPTVDIFAMSSAWEGLPIALIEATLTGLPVIVTDVGGCREIVEHVGNGIVVNSQDCKEYADKLYELTSNTALLNEFHYNALHNSQEYTIQYAVEKHISLYNKKYE